MKFKLTTLLLAFAILTTLTFNSCVKDKTPTKERMTGVWEVTGAFDEQGNDILTKINHPVTVIDLNSDNTVISTAGPMMMFVVYGPSNYTTIASTIDQVFNYATLSFNGGEFFIADGVQERFTLEMKLEGLPGEKALTTLLSLLNIQSQWLNVVVYHKFMDVNVTFDPTYNTMTWTLDNTTTAVYNTKDAYGNYVLWQGFPVTNFQHCHFVLTKRSQTIQDIVQAHH